MDIPPFRWHNDQPSSVTLGSERHGGHRFKFLARRYPPRACQVTVASEVATAAEIADDLVGQAVAGSSSPPRLHFRGISSSGRPQSVVVRLFSVPLSACPATPAG